MLTTYETLLLENKTLSKISWKAIIVDEGQKLKNHKSKIFNATVKLSTKIRILLSSSPLHNSIEDLLNTTYFISPDKFSELVPENLKIKYYKAFEEVNKSYLKIDEMYELEEDNIQEVKMINEDDQNNATHKVLINNLKELIQPHFL